VFFSLSLKPKPKPKRILICLFVCLFLASREKVLAADKSYDRVAQSKALYAWRWTYATIVYPLFEPMIVNVDFRWVFLIRLLMQLGQYTVQVRSRFLFSIKIVSSFLGVPSILPGRLRILARV